ncbi:hypothetical protein LG3211_5356 [Lysobacter gummosus]|nr:hypothetical protein LG3211_5356 [Lysobacter gummosus]
MRRGAIACSLICTTVFPPLKKGGEGDLLLALYRGSNSKSPLPSFSKGGKARAG